MSPKQIWLMVIHATFKNISVISWLSVLLVEETGVPKENHRPVASHWQTLSHHVISSTPRQLLVVIGTYCTEACKSTDYHTITATTAIQNKTKYENTLLLLLRNEIYTDTGEQNKTKYEKTLLLLLRHEIYTDTGEQNKTKYEKNIIVIIKTWDLHWHRGTKQNKIWKKPNCYY